MKRGTPGFVGARLKEAREARGLTAAALADILGVSRQAVSQYENEQQSPRPEIMAKVEQVLNLPQTFFYRPVPERKPETRRIFYRSMNSATKLARVRVERRYEWLTEIAAYLREYINFPPVRYPHFDVPHDPRQLSWEDVEDFAARTREFWGLGDGPISNVVWLLENKGAVVARGMIEADELDAFSEWHEWQAKTGTPYVFLGADKESGPRSRFDAAHELGHLVMHRDIDPKYISNRTTFKVIEEQAHRFAGAFLLPALAFSNDFSVANLDAFMALKPKWKVSVALMVHRSEDLDLASKEQVQRLWINRTRRGWRQKEPLDDQLLIEKPRLLKRALTMIVEEGIQSLDDIRGALPYSAGDIVELANLPPHFLEEDVAPISLKAYSKKRYGGTGRASRGSGEVVEFRTAEDGSEGY
jgi:Zn-dependent peptidase ImmA (M78 family)/transcriptional regulator with XRE-family HTH domain